MSIVKINHNYNKSYKTVKLNIDKIKDLEDVKRILEFLSVEVTIDNNVVPHGWDKVKNLFE